MISPTTPAPIFVLASSPTPSNPTPTITATAVNIPVNTATPISTFHFIQNLASPTPAGTPTNWIPRGVAVDPSGNIFVTDIQKWNQPVHVYSPNGTLLFSFGTNGSGVGQCSTPYGIAIDGSGNVYVMDQSREKILKFSNNGNFLSEFGSAGTGSGQFQSPKGLALDPSGNLYEADETNKCVGKFDNNGNFITQFSATGSGGNLIDPKGVAVDPTGQYVYVADAGGYRVVKYTTNGAYVSQTPCFDQTSGNPVPPDGVGVDAQENIYASAYSHVQVFDTNGNYKFEFGTPGLGPGQFMIGYLLAVDRPTGNVITVSYDTVDSAVVEYGP